MKELSSPDPEYTKSSYEYLSEKYRASIEHLVATCWIWLEYLLIVLIFVIYSNNKTKENSFNEDDMLGINGTHDGPLASNEKALQIQKDAKYGNPSGGEAYKKTEEMPDTMTNTDINKRAIEKKKK